MEDSSSILNEIEVLASQPDHERTLERWEDDKVQLLIVSYLKFKGLFGKPNNMKKSVFHKIALELNKHSDIKVHVTGEQCLRKWKKLETKQKEIDDNKKQTRRTHKTWKERNGMRLVWHHVPFVSKKF